MRRAPRAAGAVLLGLVVLGAVTACTDGGVPAPGAAQVDVDTPELREAKAAAGVEDCRPGDAEPTTAEDGLPELTLPCFGGGPDVDLATLRGPMVISVWASWCGPCRKEMPVLQEFHEQHGDQVPLLGIDYSDPQTGSAMDLVEETGATYPMLADPQEDISAASPFPVMRGLPWLGLVDEDGRLVYGQAMVVESRRQLEDLVAEHLGVDL
jgi:thiol-disulfide isomerase/thioredoxin